MSSQISLRCWRLLLAYLIAMSAILGTFATVVYIFYNRSLSQQWNEELLALAKATIPSLKTFKSKGSKRLEQDWDKNLPWHHLIESEQGLEWFNAEGKLITKAGKVFPNFLVAQDLAQVSWQQYSQVQSQRNDSEVLLQTDYNSPKIEPSKPQPTTVAGEQKFLHIQQQSQIRSVTVFVYTHNANKKTLQLEGYIRASESTRQVEAALHQFRLELGLGGMLALILSSLSALYLTRLTLKPLQQSQERLKYFSTGASHKLRNPLTALNTTVELMQSHPEQLKPSDAKKLAIIASASEQIGCLVEDLIFLARSDCETALSHLEPSIPLDEVLEDLVARFETQAQSKGINFESRLPPGITVKGDTNLLIRLFSNLLENALEYIKEGGMVILSLDKCRRFAIVRLDDADRGIPAKYLPRFFQYLWQVDQGLCPDKEELRLGAAISEAIVERHRGKIKVDNQVGVGSYFQVHLPLFLG